MLSRLTPAKALFVCAILALTVSLRFITPELYSDPMRAIGFTPDHPDHHYVLTSGTDGWTTYHSDTFGFEFIYPSDWELSSPRGLDAWIQDRRLHEVNKRERMSKLSVVAPPGESSLSRVSVTVTDSSVCNGPTQIDYSWLGPVLRGGQEFACVLLPRTCVDVPCITFPLPVMRMFELVPTRRLCCYLLVVGSMREQGSPEVEATIRRIVESFRFVD